MNITVEDLGDGVKRVVLAGRMDVGGVDAVDLPLSAAAGAARHLLVDMDGVSYVASLGVRSLLVAAKLVNRRGGRMAIAAPRPFVADVLRATGIDQIIPIHPDAAAAHAALTAA